MRCSYESCLSSTSHLYNPLDCNMRTDNDISHFLLVHMEINIIYEYDHIYLSCIAQTVKYTHKLLFFNLIFTPFPEVVHFLEI